MNKKRIITIAVLIAIMITGGILINSTKVSADTGVQQIVVQPSILVTPMGTGTTTSTLITEKFSDVKNTDWHIKYVNYLSDKEYLNGYPDGTFKPDNNITVAEFIKIIISSNGNKIKSAEGNIPWYTTFVDEAKRMGLVLEGEFSENDYDRNITRGEMARIIARGTDLMVNQPEIKNPLEDYKKLISDYKNIPTNLQNFIFKAYARGIINGYPDGTFKQEKNATRAEACVMINKFLEVDLRIIPEIKVVVTPLPTEKEPLLNESGFPLRDGKPMVMKDFKTGIESPINIVNEDAIDYYVEVMEYLQDNPNYNIEVVNNFEQITIYVMKKEQKVKTFYELKYTFYFDPNGNFLNYPYRLEYKQPSEENQKVFKDILKIFYPTGYTYLHDKMMYLYSHPELLKEGSTLWKEEGFKDNRGYFTRIDTSASVSILVGK